MAGTVHLICGLICSGKSTYAAKLKAEHSAVVLSCDRLMLSLFPDGLGDAHDAMTERARAYLLAEAVELSQAGCDVILDWGFWQADYRRQVTNQLQAAGCKLCWHYLHIAPQRWDAQIARRNAHLQQGHSGDYLVDEGLKAKCLALFQPPARSEVDVWVEVGECGFLLPEKED